MAFFWGFDLELVSNEAIISSAMWVLMLGGGGTCTQLYNKDHRRCKDVYPIVCYGPIKMQLHKISIRHPCGLGRWQVTKVRMNQY